MAKSVRLSSARARAALTVSGHALCLGLLLAGGAAVAQSTGADDTTNSSPVANPSATPTPPAADVPADQGGTANPSPQAAPATAAAASGQDQTAATGAAVDDGAGDTIVVTGFRRSLESAISQKKSVDLIVESVSAEDIGKLPDASIAESIARLPGLTAQRSAGRDTTIAIRGFSPDFSTTLLNGREQTSTGDNRAVEYDQYPAEVINQVVVYKSGQANIIGQGLSGTVDLRTIRPIEFGKRVISFGARGSYDDKGRLNPDSDKYGFRVNGVFVDQFADGKVGVALSTSYSHETYQIEEFNAWGYFNPDATGNAAISGSKSYNTSNTLKRFGITGTLEFKPTETFTSTFDGFYSNFKDDQLHRGIELPFSYFGAQFVPAGAQASNGLYTDGTFANVQGVVRNNAFQRHAKLYSFGWNNSFKSDTGWGAFFDISYSKTKRSENDLESYSGTGYNWSGNDPTNTDRTDTLTFHSGKHGTSFSNGTLDYSDPSLIKLTDPLGWGGNVVQAGYNNNRLISDRIWQYRAEVSKEFDAGPLHSVQLGANYTNHDKSLNPVENFLVLASGADEETIPGDLIKSSTNLKYLGLGPILTYNPFALIDQGVYALQPNAVPNVFVKAYTVSEDLLTFYAQGNIKAELGDNTLTGNFGVQAVNTEQKSSGNAIVNGAGGLTLSPYTDGRTYWDVMPSVNLSLRMPSDLVIRAAASREVMRPRMSDMRASFEYTTTNNPATGQIIPTGTRGDPRLKPYRANAFDLTVEKYFGLKGYIAAQGFYKRFTSYVITGQQVAYDFTGLPFTGTQPTTTQGFLTTPINLKGIKLYGVEVAGTLPFGQFASALDGFGVTGSGAWTKAKSPVLIDGLSTPPGYSKWVANGTLFFEKWGFSARGSVRYRSKFRGEVTGFGDDRVLREAKPEVIVDGQIGYDFAPDSFLHGLSIYVQGQNLTDRPFVTYQPGNTDEIIDYQEFGRRFLAGFTYKF